MGLDHVAAFLRDYDLAAFDPKAPPPKTSVFWEIVGANRAPEDSELATLLVEMGEPAEAAAAIVETVQAVTKLRGSVTPVPVGR